MSDSDTSSEGAQMSPFATIERILDQSGIRASGLVAGVDVALPEEVDNALWDSYSSLQIFIKDFKAADGSLVFTRPPWGLIRCKFVSSWPCFCIHLIWISTVSQGQWIPMNSWHSTSLWTRLKWLSSNGTVSDSAIVGSTGEDSLTSFVYAQWMADSLQTGAFLQPLLKASSLGLFGSVGVECDLWTSQELLGHLLSPWGYPVV